MLELAKTNNCDKEGDGKVMKDISAAMLLMISGMVGCNSASDGATSSNNSLTPSSVTSGKDSIQSAVIGTWKHITSPGATTVTWDDTTTYTFAKDQKVSSYLHSEMFQRGYLVAETVMQANGTWDIVGDSIYITLATTQTDKIRYLSTYTGTPGSWTITAKSGTKERILKYAKGISISYLFDGSDKYTPIGN